MKQRMLTGSDEVKEDVLTEERKTHKVLSDRRQLRLFCRTLMQKHMKFVLIISMLLLFVVIVCVYMYFYELIAMQDKSESDYEKYISNHMLPIGNATDDDYYITRPNGRDDGGVVRVMFAIVSTYTDWTLCYAVASAYFNNIPIIVSGYKKENFANLKKPSIFRSAIDQAGLRDSDVVLALDADIMFTGLDYLSFIDKFIKLSPANLNELDAKAVRTGKAMAPSIYGTEKNCYAPQTLGLEGARCQTAYEQVYQKHKKYVDSLTEFAEKPFVNYDDNTLEHLNSGTSIQRVWAMRKLFAAFHKFMANNRPLGDKEWECDQSVFSKLYLELRLWEIEQDYFRKQTDELRIISNEYGLYAGIMGLDLKGEFSVMVHPTLTSDIFEITTEHWLTDQSEETKSINVFDKDEDVFVQKLFNKTDVKKLFTQRKLTRSYSNVHSVTIAPPLLSIKPRHINGKDKPAERVYPALIHFAAPTTKYERENAALHYMQWSLPIMFDKEQWKRSKQYVMSMPIELWTSNDEKLRLRYGDVCEKHPFNQSQVIV